MKKQGLMRWLSNHDRDAETIFVLVAVVVAAGLFLKSAFTPDPYSFLWMEAAFLSLAFPFAVLATPKKIIATIAYAIVSVGLLALTYSLPAWSPAVIALTILAGAIGMWKIRTMD